MKIYYGTNLQLNENDRSLFSRGNYECVELFQTRQGNPVIISQSKNNDFTVWKVEHGFSSVIFGSYDEAITFCKQRFNRLDGKPV